MTYEKSKAHEEARDIYLHWMMDCEHVLGWPEFVYDYPHYERIKGVIGPHAWNAWEEWVKGVSGPGDSDG